MHPQGAETSIRPTAALRDVAIPPSVWCVRQAKAIKRRRRRATGKKRGDAELKLRLFTRHERMHSSLTKYSI